MKIFKWNEEKNRKLLEQRDITFDEIVQTIREQGYFESIIHPKPKRYPKQRIIIVKIKGYVCLIPFVKNRNNYFLKTIYPSRKLNKLYKRLEKEGYDKIKTEL